MKDERLKELEQDNVGKEMLAFIPNNLGINLCSVRNITISRQKDGQLKDIHITFNPSCINENQRIVTEWQSNNPNGKKMDCCRDTGVSRPTIDKYWNTSMRDVDNEDTWLDYTDYFPSADGFGYDPTETYWNFVCPRCDYHYFDASKK